MAAVTVLDQFTGRSINKVHNALKPNNLKDRWREIKINNVVINSPQSLKICFSSFFVY